MAASVRGGTHTIVEDALGRCHREMEHTFIEEPFAEWYSEEGQLEAQRLDPDVILMDHEDRRRSDTREMLYFHEPSRMRIRRVRYSSQHRPKRRRKEDFAHARKGTKSGRATTANDTRPRRGARSSLSSNRLSCLGALLPLFRLVGVPCIAAFRRVKSLLCHHSDRPKLANRPAGYFAGATSLTGVPLALVFSPGLLAAFRSRSISPARRS